MFVRGSFVRSTLKARLPLAILLLIVSFKNPWLETVGQTPGRGLEIQLRSGAPLDGRGRLWAVVIGISQYKYVPRESQLRFAHRDAQDFARLLQSPNGGAFPSNQIRLLLNQDATISAIRTSLGTWLARSVEPEDVVYIYFAGHGLVENEKEGYLLAHDSDPQNLYATALPVEELDRMLTERLRARTVVLIADACHAGRIGLSSRGGESRALITRYLDELGKTESSIFRLLATRANERSYEDEKWGGGHGVFTYYLLEGLRGRADKDQDGIVRAAELLTYLSETVPEATQALQHPRAAGYLDPRLPLAVVSRPGNTVAVSETRPSSLEIRGIPGTQVYVDNSFRGSIRPTGLLIIEGLSAGSHDLSIDPPNSEQFSQKVSLGTGKTTIELQRRAGATTQSSPLVAAIRTALQKKNVLETGGAWSLYQQMIASSPNEPQRRAVETMLAGSLEELGQEAINQYVHSSIWQLDRDSFRRGAIAFNNLKQLNSGDPSLEAKYLFCSGRALIVEGRAPEALPLLQRAVTLDPKAAYIYNALGVAQERAGADREALSAFTRATELAPNWSVPRLHLGIYYFNKRDAKRAEVELKQSAAMDESYPLPRLLLARICRDQRRLDEAESLAAAIISKAPDYSPAYAELGLIYQLKGDHQKALSAFETYLQRPALESPEAYDRNEIRSQAERERRLVNQPTMRRKP